MIKRRFYKVDHGDRSSDDSDSDSDNSNAATAIDSEEEEEQEVVLQEQETALLKNRQQHKADELKKGYVDELRSDDESDVEVAGSAADKKKGKVRKRKHQVKSDVGKPLAKSFEEDIGAPADVCNKGDPIDADADNCIIKIKSVFKCRLCPTVLCLNEETVRNHLKSKRHSRSKKLLLEGKLKLTLNSDGVLEEDQETHAERHARILAIAQQPKPPKRDRGRQRKNPKRK